MPVFYDEEFGKITVRRSNRATQIRIRVNADGLLNASLPVYAPIFLVKKLIKNSRPDLRKLLASARPKYTFKDGMAIGKSHLLNIQIKPEANFSVVHKKQQINIISPDQETLLLQKNDRLIRDAISNALRLEAKSYLPNRLKFLAKRYNFQYKKVRFSHASGRWGSCSSSGTISLNIAIMQLPFELIDYILIHELSHTKQMNHGRGFWQVVESACPEYKRCRREIKNYTPSI